MKYSKSTPDFGAKIQSHKFNFGSKSRILAQKFNYLILLWMKYSNFRYKNSIIFDRERDSHGPISLKIILVVVVVPTL